MAWKAGSRSRPDEREYPCFWLLVCGVMLLAFLIVSFCEKLRLLRLESTTTEIVSSSALSQALGERCNKCNNAITAVEVVLRSHKSSSQAKKCNCNNATTAAVKVVLRSLKSQELTSQVQLQQRNNRCCRYSSFEELKVCIRVHVVR